MGLAAENVDRADVHGDDGAMMCQHGHKTMCGRYDTDAAYYVGDDIRQGAFVAWQCDDCGRILPDPVPAEALARTDLPRPDYQAHEAAILAAARRAWP